MKLVYRNFETVFEMQESEFIGIVIEDAKTLWCFLCAIRDAINGMETGIVISEQNVPISLSKKLFFISDYLNLSLNQKNLINKIVSEMEGQALNSENYQKANKLLADIERFVTDLSFSFPYELNMEKLSIQNLLKSLGLTVQDEFESLEELLIAYMELLREYEKREYFILYNVRPLVSRDRLKLFTETLLIRGFKYILVDNIEMEKLPGENRVIIDRDLCEI